jgi:predicted nucleic acid-binding protein
LDRGTGSTSGPRATVLYLDTSALVKLYAREEGREEVQEAVRASTAVAVSEIGYVEARSALARKEREGSLSAEEHDEAAATLRKDFREVYLARPVTGEVLLRAGELVREHALRAYDAVHLATALLLREELEGDKVLRDPGEREENGAPLVELMAYDGDLATAARKEGLA